MGMVPRAYDATGEGSNHLGRRLDKFDQHAFAADRHLVAALRMNEAHVVACRAFADAARCEAYALAL